MKKLLVALALLLFFGGICMIGVGSVLNALRSAEWSKNIETEAAKLCHPDETLAVTRRDTGTRVYYNYYCDDTQGNRRDINDELGGPGLDASGLVFPGLGGCWAVSCSLAWPCGTTSESIEPSYKFALPYSGTAARFSFSLW